MTLMTSRGTGYRGYNREIYVRKMRTAKKLTKRLTAWKTKHSKDVCIGNFNSYQPFSRGARRRM